ncbi:MAG: hypothetical protein Q8N53_17170 [Longimicrobiales bacterium]|nr:hypothetical protein [Longimicrobiales bacterium]
MRIQLVRGPALAAAALLATACGGGGPRHVSEITPVMSERLSGAWALNEAESDDPEEALGGGGQGAGMAPGDAPGRNMKPAAMQALRRMATGTPRTLQISLADSLAVVAFPREEPWILPFGGKVTRELSEDVEVEARAQWENNRLILTRQVSGGGVVVETFMPSVDGKRLTVAVEFSPGGRGGVEFQRVYERPGA